MAMDSMEALCKLRALKEERHKEKLQCAQIQMQLKKINALREEKEALFLHLQALQAGEQTDDEVNGGDDILIRQSTLKIKELKEKIWAFKTIGPCGLTVMDSESDCLVVAFTGLYKQCFTENFVLQVKCSGGATVNGTTIPYFINVQEMLDKEKPVDWNIFMDKVSRLISAYIQRKGDVEDAKTKYNTVVKSCDANSPFTVVDLVLNLPGDEEGQSHQLRCHMTYPDLDSIHPSNARVTADTEVFPEEVLQEVKSKLMSQPLTKALASLVGDLEGFSQVSMDSEGSEAPSEH